MQRFDQAPVRDDGRLIGWVHLTQLTGRGFVSSSMVPLDRCAVLARTSQVGDVIPLVAQRDLVFLAGSSGIVDFIVPSDFDRHVVRSYLYVLLAEIEFLLADLVRDNVSNDVVLEYFRPREKARYQRARDEGKELHAVEYLYLRDYIELGDHVPALRSLTSWPREEQRRDLQLLNVLRNCVAHPSKSITSEFDAVETAERAQLARTLLQRLRSLTKGVRGA